MKTLNRSIAILKPKQLYIDWIKSTTPKEKPTTIEAESLDCSTILIPPYDTDDEAMAYTEAEVLR